MTSNDRLIRINRLSRDFQSIRVISFIISLYLILIVKVSKKICPKISLRSSELRNPKSSDVRSKAAKWPQHFVTGRGGPWRHRRTAIGPASVYVHGTWEPERARAIGSKEIHGRRTTRLAGVCLLRTDRPRHGGSRARPGPAPPEPSSY